MEQRGLDTDHIPGCAEERHVFWSKELGERPRPLEPAAPAEGGIAGFRVLAAGYIGEVDVAHGGSMIPVVQVVDCYGYGHRKLATVHRT